MKTNLELVDDCDNFPYYDQQPEHYYQFRLLRSWQVDCTVYQNVGLLLPSTVETMPWTDKWKVDHERHFVTIPYHDAPQGETQAIEALLDKARSADVFQVLRGWRNELFNILHMDRDVLIERAGSMLFGIETTGVHMTAFVRNPPSTGTAGGEGQGESELSIWVPRRARTKQTYGGMLDNTVAGAMSAGEGAFETLVRESAEEASFAEDLVRKGAKACGAVSYFHVRDSRAGGETGLLQPETQYVYDLELAAGEGVEPRPSDEEVEEFYLWSVGKVQRALGEGQFKPNCAVVLIDFLIRHGIITAENEPDYLEIIARIHRRLQFDRAT